MKRLIVPLLVLSLAVLACSLPSTVTPPPSATEPTVATQPPTATIPPVVVNATCSELSLYIDPALASGYDCQTIPESSYEMEQYPEHTQLTLVGYPLVDKFFEAHILVYPVQRYTELLPDWIPVRVARLQSLFDGPAPDFANSFGTALPFLPLFNAGQVFFAQYQVVPFVDGRGIRFLTEYAQYTAPVNNHDMFYTYQGLTNDGKYWVVAILPANHTMLPADAVNPPGGQTWEEFSNNYEDYIIGMVGQLNAQAADSFAPPLTALDALIKSIVIQP